jgi:GTP-binding protein
MARRVDYLKTAVYPKDYPKADRPEIAIAGRSNAGKSSFINGLSKSQVAKTSQEPGKTRTLNFYNVGEFYRLVDMPGYGFAARARGEQEMWQEMVETYLEERVNLVGLMILLDIRRDWAADEEMIVRFCQRRNIPVVIVLSKADQMKTNEKINKIALIKKASQQEQVWPTSSLKKEGIEEVEKYVFDNWVLKYNKADG